MASTRSERVENALQSLLERLVPPQQPGEDEEAADQRWEDANNLASEIIHRGDSQPVPAEDVNHAADYVCILFIFIYTFGYSIGFGPAAWVYGSEVIMNT